MNLRPEWLVLSLGALAFAVEAIRPQQALPPVGEAARRIEQPAAERLRSSPLATADDDFGSRGGEQEVERWIRAEVLYREALRLGLDQGDIIVRRRLVQKMEYLLDGMAELPEVSPADLDQYYRENAGRYSQGLRYSFRHLYFSTADGVDAALARAGEALRQLHAASAPGDASGWGDPYPEGSQYRAIDGARVLQRFGEEFLRELDSASLGSWSGPYRSQHGVHLVFRTETVAASPPPLAEIRQIVARDLLDEARREQREQHYAAIEARYDIVRR